MSEQPTALRLADALEQMPGYDWNKNYCEAAAELRRLVAENERFRDHIAKQNTELDALIPMAEKLEAENEALRAFAQLVLRGLESGAIKAKPIIEMDDNAPQLEMRSLGEIARAAIAKAGGA